MKAERLSSRWSIGMQKIFAIVVGVAVFATASTMVKHVQADTQNTIAFHATDAAYRDGLFLGQLDAKQGREVHIAVGRWSSLARRESFKAGYRAGYAEGVGNSAEAGE
jgi:hypothetical protein